ncbi:MAG: Ig-like domain-containing protein [Armatimonadota bacterium]
MTAQRRKLSYLVLAGAGALLLLVLAVAWACDDPWIEINGVGEGDPVQGDVPLAAVPTSGGTSASWLPDIFGLREAKQPGDGEIARVEFLARGKRIDMVGAGPPWRTTWDTKKFHDGHCNLKAVAYDASGGYLGRSRTVRVVVGNLIEIDEPTFREVVSGTVTISGRVRAGVTASKLRLCVQGQRLAETAESSFSFEWDSTSVDDGEHVLRVRLYDGKKRVGHGSVRVVVNNPYPLAQWRVARHSRHPSAG